MLLFFNNIGRGYYYLALAQHEIIADNEKQKTNKQNKPKQKNKTKQNKSF